MVGRKEWRCLRPHDLRYFDTRMPRSNSCTSKILSTHSTEALDQKDKKLFGEAKARLTFNKNVACAGLQDADKAIGFLEEAKTYKPQSAGFFDAKINALRDERRQAPRID